MNINADLQSARFLLATRGIEVLPASKRRALFEDRNFNGLADHYERKVRLEEDILREYQEAINPGRPFSERVRRFLAATSKTGRRAKAIKDFALLFVPLGGRVKSVTEFIVKRFIQPQEDIMMNNETTAEKIKRFLSQPSTQAGISFVIMVVGSIWAGVDIDAETFTQSVVGVIAALAALWTAVTNLINIFRDEEKSVEKRKASKAA